jgi:SAM-dependent methyltransferase
MNESILDKLIRKLRLDQVISQISSQSVVVDIGCGYNAKLLTDLKKHIKLGIGIDQKVEFETQDNITLKKLTLDNKLPVEDNIADVVTLLAVIEHVKYPEELIQESFRVLKPGGKILITTPTPRARVPLEIMAFNLGIIDKREILDHKNYFWGFQLYNILKNSGFDNIEWHEFELGMNTFIKGSKAI